MGLDMIGKVFGRLTVVAEAGKDKHGQLAWYCICECGKRAIVSGYVLRRGTTRSCGCLRQQAIALRAATHGLSKHPLYLVLAQIKGRVLNKQNASYENYGGRGIKICDRWHPNNPNSLLNFMEDMLPTYKEGLSINRIDPNGDYCPENCEWATNIEQGHFKRKQKNKSSIYYGVSFYKNIGKFVAQIRENRNREYLGCFENEADAALAYDNRSEELFGDRPNGTLKDVDNHQNV